MSTKIQLSANIQAGESTEDVSVLSLPQNLASFPVENMEMRSWRDGSLAPLFPSPRSKNGDSDWSGAGSITGHFDCLAKHKETISSHTISQLFESDPFRFERFSLQLDDILFDFSKNRVAAQTMELLTNLARAAGVEQKRDDMFSGLPVNATENRAALHMALRSKDPHGFSIAGRNVMTDVHRVLDQMEEFSDKIRTGLLRGATGQKFTDIVNVGVGGSDLGPALAVAALRPYHDGPRCHFVSNMDGAHIADILSLLNPATTLFVIASKSFTTDETMTNAATARAWTVETLGEVAIAAHFVALSTNLPAVSAFGIREDFRFEFWDWVGGRYSLWSAIGLPICLAIGFRNFSDFLAGAEAVDDHFKTAPLEQNIPVIMALLGVWYRNIWKFPTHAVVPYNQRLARFPAYLQQLDMESNGKRIGLNGDPVQHETAPIVWGESGTNGQHAFFQLIHQGTDIVPVDFLIAARCHEPDDTHHTKLVANCFAQSEALMRGKSRQDVRTELRGIGLGTDKIDQLLPHKVMPGNRPSNTFLFKQLDPMTLGRLIALYEHKTFVQGAIWGVNSFDQWGVELGKQLAMNLTPFVEGRTNPPNCNGSTSELIKEYLRKSESIE